MALVAASASQSTSDTNKPAIDTGNLAISAINALISAAANAGLYKINLDLEAKLTNNIIQIKQSDDSYIDLTVIGNALLETGYRASCNKKNIRDGFKINLTVAWN